MMFWPVTTLVHVYHANWAAGVTTFCNFAEGAIKVLRNADGGGGGGV